MFKIPIAYFTFKRSKNFGYIFDLFKAINASKIYIFSDGGRDSSEQSEVEQTRDIIDSHDFGETEVIKIYSEHNNGPYTQIAEGAKKIFQNEEKCIFIEDDNIPEKSFFYFCEKMLEEYKNDPTVAMIYGTNYLLKYPHFKSKNKYFKTRHSLPCGWASWSHKFLNFYDTEHFLEILDANIEKVKNNYYQERMYNHDKTLWNSEKKLQMKYHKNTAWDVQLNFYLRLYNLFAISPCYNQIKNNGIDQNATNTTFGRFGIINKICPKKSYDNTAESYCYIGDKMSKKYDIKINTIRIPSTYMSYKIKKIVKLFYRFCRKIKRFLIKKRSKHYWNIINKKYAGCFSDKAFSKKRNAMIKLGFDLGDNVRIVGPIFITSKLNLGNNVFIGKNCSFEGNGFISIGNNVDIAPNVIINTGGHLVGNHSHRAGEGMVTKISIGNGCWIGNSAMLFNNISIGDGSVVAAGSIVKSSFPENVLIAGNPGVIKKRYLD